MTKGWNLDFIQVRRPLRRSALLAFLALAAVCPAAFGLGGQDVPTTSAADFFRLVPGEPSATLIFENRPIAEFRAHALGGPPARIAATRFLAFRVSRHTLPCREGAR